jgi:WD40 repeat protein
MALGRAIGVPLHSASSITLISWSYGLWVGETKTGIVVVKTKKPHLSVSRRHSIMLRKTIALLIVLILASWIFGCSKTEVPEVTSELESSQPTQQTEAAITPEDSSQEETAELETTPSQCSYTSPTVLDCGGKSIWDMAYSPDGDYLAFVVEGKMVTLWDNVAGREVRSFLGHDDDIWSIAFSPDGKILATASKDNSIKLWEVASGREVDALLGHGDWVNTVAFSPDGTVIASGSDDETIKLWDAMTGDELTTLEQQNYVYCIAFSSDGKTLASGDIDGKILLWDSETGEVLRGLTGHGGSLGEVSFSPLGNILASGGDDEKVKLWDISSGEMVQEFVHLGGVNSVAFSADGRYLASASGGVPWNEEHTVKIWDMETNQELYAFNEHTASIYSVEFSPDGKYLASASEDGTIIIRDLTAGL